MGCGSVLFSVSVIRWVLGHRLCLVLWTSLLSVSPYPPFFFSLWELCRMTDYPVCFIADERSHAGTAGVRTHRTTSTITIVTTTGRNRHHRAPPGQVGRASRR